MARKTINLTEMSLLKKHVSERFAAELHYHGSCGGQSFSMSSSSMELRDYLTDYFGSRDIGLVFSGDGLRFYTTSAK